MGYDRNDCWMTCGERDDKCAAMGLMDGPLTKDPFAEIERLRAIIRTLAPTGTPEAVSVRKMTTFEEAEAIYAGHQQSAQEKSDG